MMKGAYLGPSYTNKQAISELKKLNAVYKVYNQEDLNRSIAKKFRREM